MVGTAQDLAEVGLASTVSDVLRASDWRAGRVSAPAPRPVRAKIGGALWVLAGAEIVGLALVFGGDGAPRPLTEILRLASATVVGFAVRAACRRGRAVGDVWRTPGYGHVTLSIAGALMALLIGNPMALGLAVAGATGVILFRSPHQAPREAGSLLVVYGLGMACGAGAISAAALGAVILCLFLVLLSPRHSPVGG